MMDFIYFKIFLFKPFINIPPDPLKIPEVCVGSDGSRTTISPLTLGVLDRGTLVVNI